MPGSFDLEPHLAGTAGEIQDVLCESLWQFVVFWGRAFCRMMPKVFFC